MTELSHPNMEGYCRTYWDKEKYEEGLKKALANPSFTAEPDLLQALKNPDEGTNPILVDIMLNPFSDAPFWQERKVDYSKIKIPAYIGCCWGHLGLHLPGAFRSRTQDCR